MDAQAGKCPPQNVLDAYSQGGLEVSAAQSIAGHLEGCANCRIYTSTVVQQARARQSKAEPPRQRTMMAGESISAAGSETPAAEFVPPSAAPQAKPTHSAMSAGVDVPPELANHADYELIRELGRGGMGVVYLARNRIMDRHEVLKVVDKSLLNRPGALERFQQEIRSAAKLSHPNIVAAYSVLRPGDWLVFAMEYVNGQDLAQVVGKRGPLPVVNAAFYAHQVALGLQHAHEKTMVHRDIKPNNLMLSLDGKKHVIKILDFGLAKATSEKAADAWQTKSGQMLGTPDYVAPEQMLDAQKADIRADVYSLGCTLYFFLTGRPPFEGNSLFEILQAHHTVEATRLNLVRPDVPAELAEVVAKMMAKAPAARYQTPAEIGQALSPFFKAGGAGPKTQATPIPVLQPLPSVATSVTPAPGAEPVAQVVTAAVPLSVATGEVVDLGVAAAEPTRARPKRSQPAAATVVAAVLLNLLLLGAGLVLFSLFAWSGKHETVAVPPPRSSEELASLGKSVDAKRPTVPALSGEKAASVISKVAINSPQIPAKPPPIRPPASPIADKSPPKKSPTASANRTPESGAGKKSGDAHVDVVMRRETPAKPTPNNPSPPMPTASSDLLTGPAAKDDSLAAELAKAKAEFDKELAAYLKTIDEYFSQREESAQKQQNAKLLEKVHAERHEFESLGRLPAKVTTTLRKRGPQIESVMSGEYQRAFDAYDAANRPDKAAAVAKEYERFLATTVWLSDRTTGGGFASRNPAFRRLKLASQGGTPESERAVLAALNWLARHQSPAGNWSLAKYTTGCKDKTCTGAGNLSSDTAATGLALLPFLAAGYTHNPGVFHKSILNGLTWLISAQKPDGSLISGKGNMYSHALAALCLCEAYGMTKDRKIGPSAQAAIHFIESAQNKKDGGWRYTPGQAGDTSVVGWQVAALKSALMAGLQVNANGLDRAKAYLKLASAKSKSGGIFSYEPNGPPIVSMTAVGLLASQYLGLKHNDPAMREGSGLLMANLPGKSSARNVYYWYYGTQAMHNLGGPQWDQWNQQMRQLLVETQIKEGCATGSWDPLKPTADAWAEPGGRLMVTCFSALTLEVYYRYPLIYPPDEIAE